MDKIVIDFTADPGNIKTTIDYLEKIGKVDAANAAQMRQNHDAYVRYMAEQVKSQDKVTESVKKGKQAHESSFNSLNNSINQLSRELPAFTFSMQTGFLAISNNIPALADGIKQLTLRNAELSKSGQQTESVLKAVAGAVFSWQTLLSVGVTILTVYGAKIIDAAANLLKEKDATELNTEALASYNKAHDEAIKRINDLIDARDKNILSILKESGVIDEFQQAEIQIRETAQEKIIKAEEKYIERHKQLIEELGMKVVDENNKEVKNYTFSELEKLKVINNGFFNIEERLKDFGKKENEIGRDFSRERKAIAEESETAIEAIQDKALAKLNEKQKKAHEKEISNARKLKADKERLRLNELKALEDWWESYNLAQKHAFDQDNKERADEYQNYLDGQEAFNKMSADIDEENRKARHNRFVQEAEDRKKIIRQMYGDIRTLEQTIFKGAENAIQSNINTVDAKMNMQERAIDQQKLLAEQGLKNDLAFEIRRQDELEKVRLNEQKKLKKAKELEIFLNAMIKYTESEKNPISALGKAAGVVAATKIAEAVYAEEGGVLGKIGAKSYITMAGASRSHPGGGDVLVHAQKGEGFVSLSDMRNLQAGLLPKWMAGMIGPLNNKLIPSKQSAAIDFSGLQAEIKELKEVVKNKKETTYTSEFVDNILTVVKTEVEAGLRKKTTQQVRF